MPLIYSVHFYGDPKKYEYSTGYFFEYSDSEDAPKITNKILNKNNYKQKLEETVMKLKSEYITVFNGEKEENVKFKTAHIDYFYNDDRNFSYSGPCNPFESKAVYVLENDKPKLISGEKII